MNYLRKSSITFEEKMHDKRLKEMENALEKRIEEKNRLNAEAYADWLEEYPLVNLEIGGEKIFSDWGMDCW